MLNMLKLCAPSSQFTKTAFHDDSRLSREVGQLEEDRNFTKCPVQHQHLAVMIPFIRTDYMKCSFIPRTIPDWNGLQQCQLQELAVSIQCQSC